MPEKIYVTYNYTPADRARVQRMFLEAGLLDLVVDSTRLTGFHKVGVPNEDTVAQLSAAAALYTLQPPTVHRVFQPTARELAEAPLLHMFVWIHHSPDGHPRPGVMYDDSAACPECGDGLRQASALVLGKKEVPRSGLLGTLDDEVLVHESLGAELDGAGLTGFRLGDVRDTRGNWLPWRQLIIDHQMPGMAATARGLIRGRSGGEAPCARCGRDGWFDSPSDPFLPAYSGAALEGMPDFAHAAERFGTGHWAKPIHGRRSLASRRVIVRPAVYAFFRARKIRGIRFTPVTVI